MSGRVTVTIRSVLPTKTRAGRGAYRDRSLAMDNVPSVGPFVKVTTTRLRSASPDRNHLALCSQLPSLKGCLLMHNIRVYSLNLNLRLSRFQRSLSDTLPGEFGVDAWVIATLISFCGWWVIFGAVAGIFCICRRFANGDGAREKRTEETRMIRREGHSVDPNYSNTQYDYYETYEAVERAKCS